MIRRGEVCGIQVYFNGTPSPVRLVTVQSTADNEDERRILNIYDIFQNKDTNITMNMADTVSMTHDIGRPPPYRPPKYDSEILEVLAEEEAKAQKQAEAGTAEIQKKLEEETAKIQKKPEAETEEIQKKLEEGTAKTQNEPEAGTA